MKFNDIRIGNKLIVGFSSILLIAMVIGYIGYNGMKLISVHYDEVSHNQLPGIHSLMVISQTQTAIDAAENALLADNLSPELKQAIYAKFDEAKLKTDIAMKVYDSLPLSAKESEVWKEFVPAFNDWWQHHEIFVGLAKKHDIADTEQAYNAMRDYALISNAVPFAKSEKIINQLIGINLEDVKGADIQADKEGRVALTLLLVAIMIGVLLSIALGIIISRAITVPLAKGVRLAKAVALGDLTVNIDIDQKDETGQLADALKNMVENLKNITTEIKNGAAVLGTSASEILTTVTEIITAAAETATSVTETTTTVEEVRQTSMVSNQKAQSLMKSSQKAGDSVEKGRASTDEVIASMKKIDDQMNLISDTVIKLAEQHRTIGEITTSVSDIADQSNLLAVNAAIEAAKAGEQGRGFAVVAQEIRSLSDQSKKATAQVKEILDQINKSVNQAVGVTEQGSRTVSDGRKLVAQSGEVIELLALNVEETAQASIQISSSNKQQMAGMEQIVPAMENIKIASEQQLSGIKQAQTAARDLNALGQNLKDIIEKFKM
ncbi:MAG: methyl-accepting chemotaxis protein [Bacteroidales bacterium]